MSMELRCSNCDNRLDPTDKFCRECGLPTLHRAEAHRLAAAEPPNVAELKRAMDVAADPAPFGGGSGVGDGSGGQPELTTGGVVKVTSPTFAMQMAASTLILVGLVVVLVVVGIALIVLALRF